MEAAQKGCAGPPLHLRKDSRLCKQKLQKPFVYPDGYPNSAIDGIAAEIADLD